MSGTNASVAFEQIGRQEEQERQQHTSGLGQIERAFKDTRGAAGSRTASSAIALSRSAWIAHPTSNPVGRLSRIGASAAGASCG
jgi:hypothetical protein